MSEAKHTPGPWKIFYVDDLRVWVTTDGNVPICELAGESVADIIAVQEKRVADARLIAAAPDMLKALQSTHTEFIGLAAYLETCSPEVIAENLPSLIASLQRKRELIEAAILKAGDWV